MRLCIQVELTPEELKEFAEENDRPIDLTAAMTGLQEAQILITANEDEEDRLRCLWLSKALDISRGNIL